MGNLKSFFNQNGRSIFKWIAIICVAYLLLRVINYSIKQKYESEYGNSNLYINDTIINENVSNSTNSVSNNTNEKSNNNSDVIDSFIEYCDEKNYQAAYELLDDDTKNQNRYNSLDNFINNFINEFYNLGTEHYKSKIDTDGTYAIEVYEGDILSSGNINENSKKYVKIQKNKVKIIEN